jgi:hypothetical protein
MNKLQACSMLASLIVATAAMAQIPTRSEATQPNTAPSTSPAEGTAADRTPPGHTPTQGTARDTTQQTPPAMAPAEGTAADRTPPKDRAEAGGTMHPELVGLQVVSPSDAPIGEVIDVVFDSRGQPDFVVIASEGDNAAVPYRTASSMIESGKVIMDSARLKDAPKIDRGEWRNRADSGWKREANRYWDEG